MESNTILRRKEESMNLTFHKKENVFFFKAASSAAEKTPLSILEILKVFFAPAIIFY